MRGAPGQLSANVMNTFALANRMEVFSYFAFVRCVSPLSFLALRL